MPLLQQLDDRRTRTLECGLTIDLLVEVAGQVRVALDELLRLCLRQAGRYRGGRRGDGGGRERQQRDQDGGDEAFHEGSFLLAMIFFAALSCLSAGVSMIGRSMRWVTMTSGTIPRCWMSRPFGVT